MTDIQIREYDLFLIKLWKCNKTFWRDVYFTLLLSVFLALSFTLHISDLIRLSFYPPPFLLYYSSLLSLILTLTEKVITMLRNFEMTPFSIPLVDCSTGLESRSGNDCRYQCIILITTNASDKLLLISIIIFYDRWTHSIMSYWVESTNL